VVAGDPLAYAVGAGGDATVIAAAFRAAPPP
jgi:hypothetical protein